MFAQAGHEVKLIYVYDDKVRAHPYDTMTANLNILRDEGVLDGAEIPAIMGRVTCTESLEEGASSADVIIECIVENLAVKQDYFQKLDALCPPSTILTTNTSAISVTEIAEKAVHKERIIGTHFWNPAYLIPLVEVVRTKYVSDQVVQATYDLLQEAGKKTGHRQEGCARVPGQPYAACPAAGGYLHRGKRHCRRQGCGRRHQVWLRYAPGRLRPHGGH